MGSSEREPRAGTYLRLHENRWATYGDSRDRVAERAALARLAVAAGRQRLRHLGMSTKSSSSAVWPRWG
jgi:hypothetical protein